MSRYIVTPILSPRNIPYYVVTDTSTGKGVEGYGCDTWARHRASELNRDIARQGCADGLRHERDTNGQETD